MTNHWNEAIRDTEREISAHLVGMADALAMGIGEAIRDGQDITQPMLALIRALRANAVLMGEDTTLMAALNDAQQMVKEARIQLGQLPNT